MEQTFNSSAVLALTPAEYATVQRLAGEFRASWSETVQMLLASGLFTYGLMHDDEPALECGVAMVNRTGNTIVAERLTATMS